MFSQGRRSLISFDRLRGVLLFRIALLHGGLHIRIQLRLLIDALPSLLHLLIERLRDFLRMQVKGLCDLIHCLFGSLVFLLYLFLQLAQLLNPYVPGDVSLDAADVALPTAQQMTESTRHLGQTFRADDDEGDHCNHHHLGEINIKHGG